MGLASLAFKLTRKLTKLQHALSRRTFLCPEGTPPPAVGLKMQQHRPSKRFLGLCCRSSLRQGSYSGADLQAYRLTGLQAYRLTGLQTYTNQKMRTRPGSPCANLTRRRGLSYTSGAQSLQRSLEMFRSAPSGVAQPPPRYYCVADLGCQGPS